MTSLYPLEKRFINVTFMQGIWNSNPNQDQFTSSVRPSTSLVRKENKAYLNFLLVPIIPIPEFLVGANYSNPNVDARNLSFKSDKNKSN